MEVVEIRCLTGPNYWSVEHGKLVVMKLDIQQLEAFPTNRISGFSDRLFALLPDLCNHQGSEREPGGFAGRVKKGIRLAHVVERIALAIQSLAGMEVSFGLTRPANEPGVYTVVFAYEEEQAGLYAGRAAVAIAGALVSGCSYDLPQTIDHLRRLYQTNRLGLSTWAIVQACARRGIPHIRLDEGLYVQLGYGAAQQRIQAAVTSRTSAIGVELPANRNETKRKLSLADIPVPQGTMTSQESGLDAEPSGVGEAIASMLFPGNPAAETQPGSVRPGRIPLIAVTGTNGKTTTTRLVAHIYQQLGRCVGFTTTEGVYINQHRIEEGDCTGPVSARKVLCDASVEVAVLECARGGMLRAGLAFDQCDVGVVTNVAADHLGLRDINTIDDMADVKAVVPRSVRAGGYAVLNADNEYTYAMRDRVQCNVALFSREPHSERVVSHYERGGVAAVYANGYIAIRRGIESIRVEHVANIPLTFGGKCPFMIENALAATLAAFCQGVPVEVIASGLRTFEPSDQQTPGRMNLFRFNDFSVLVDYAHNPHGLAALGEFLRQSGSTHLVGILTGVGDRRDEDLNALSQIAADIFDEIIIRLDKDVRGRDPLKLVELVRQGIWSTDPNKPLLVIPDELAALEHAIHHIRPGEMIVHLTEEIEQSIALIRQYKQQEERYGWPVPLRESA